MYADDIRGGRVFTAIYVCFPHDFSKTNATRITKRDMQMFHDESWKPIYFGVKRSKVNAMSQLAWPCGSGRTYEC